MTVIDTRKCQKVTVQSNWFIHKGNPWGKTQTLQNHIDKLDISWNTITCVGRYLRDT